VPELPEVETVRRGVEPHVVGRRIQDTVVRETRLRWPVPREFATFVRGRTIRAVDRRGKYLIFDLGGDRFIVHLGMSGRLYVLEHAVPPRRHDHVDLLLSDGGLLRFHDPRRFGAILPWPSADAEHILLARLGPEPFSAAFSGDYLFERSRGRGAPVKTFIMDGATVVGAGNIYAAEALFRAGLRPNRPAGRVTRAQYHALASAIREVLTIAIERGGTTLRDFAGAHGEAGYFQQELMVYGREGEACHRCGTGIRRAVIGQRSSCYCPSCQR
jgi:formamidopyrimidine-DNA glycosylase